MTLLLSGAVQAGADRWTLLGPPGGAANEYAFDPIDGNVVWAGSQRAVIHRSADGGLTWSAIDVGLPAPAMSNGLGPESDILSIASFTFSVSPGYVPLLFVGSRGRGALRSLDRGKTWTRINNGLPSGAGASLPAAELAAVSNMVATARGPVYARVSLDRGSVIEDAGVYRLDETTWSAMNGGLASVPATTPPTAPNRLRLMIGCSDKPCVATVNSVYDVGPPVKTGVRLYVPSSMGDEWHDFTYVAKDLVSVHAVASTGRGLLLSSGESQTIYNHDEANRTWTPFLNGAGSPIASHGNAVFVNAPGSAGIFGLRSDGTSFEPFNAGLPANASFPVLAASRPSGTAVGFVLAQGFAGGPLGTFRSPNNSAAWKRVTGVAPGQAPLASNASGTHLAASTGITVSRSVNGGAAWSMAGEGVALDTILGLAVDPSAATSVYAATSAGLYRSDDGGVWTMLSPTKERTPSVTFAGNTLYASANRNGMVYVARSADQGMSWTPAANGLPSSASEACETLIADPNDAQSLWCTVPGLGGYRTGDGGGTWTAVGWLSHGDVLAFPPGSSSVIYRGNMDGLSKSTDGGASWKTLVLPASGAAVGAVAVDPTRAEVVYAGLLNDRGIYRSRDGGATWTALNTGLRLAGAMSVRSLRIGTGDSNRVLVAFGDNHGVHEITQSDLGTMPPPPDAAATDAPLAQDAGPVGADAGPVGADMGRDSPAIADSAEVGVDVGVSVDAGNALRDAAAVSDGGPVVDAAASRDSGGGGSSPDARPGRKGGGGCVVAAIDHRAPGLTWLLLAAAAGVLVGRRREKL